PHGSRVGVLTAVFEAASVDAGPAVASSRRHVTEMTMIKPRILVTGATGKTGSVVVTELIKAGYPVRAMVRRQDDRSARLAAQGAEIAVADMSDVERVARRVEGRAARLLLSALRSVHASGCGGLRGCGERSKARAHRRPEPVAVEPLASLVDDPSALAGRSAVRDDARSWAHDPRPGLLR